MSKLSMTVREKQLRMYFDLKAWLEAEEAFGSLEDMYKQLEEGKAPMRNTLTLAAITANAGARHEGREPDVTLEWLQENLSPKQAKAINTMAKIAVVEGMKRETADDEDEPVDVVAEELQKKTEQP